MATLEFNPARRMIMRAIAIAGSEERLARLLELRESDVHAWAVGEARVPHRVFLAAVDLVAENRLSPFALRNLKRRKDPDWHGVERRAH